MEQGQAPGAVTTGLFTRGQIRDAASVLITVAALYLCWVLARPFLALITWALALAVVAHPWHARLEPRLRPGAAAALSVLTVALVPIAPAAPLVPRLLEVFGDTPGATGTDSNLRASRTVMERH